MPERRVLDGMALVPVLLGGALPQPAPLPGHTRLRLLESCVLPSGIVLPRDAMEEKPE